VRVSGSSLPRRNPNTHSTGGHADADRDNDGERRSFALLRPVVDTTAQNAVRDRILEANAEYEEAAAVATA